MTCTADILKKVDSLAPLPGTAIRLMQLVADPHSSIEAIVDAIRYDPAVTGSLLRVCNSAYAGLARQINSVDEAMIYLGTTKVLQLVLSVHAGALLTPAQRGYGLARGMLWRHSVAVALSAATFAERLRLREPTRAYTAGLLHGIGKTVLSEHVAEAFGEIVRLVLEEDRSFAEAEHQVIGMSHAELGAIIAERWKLPEQIVRCIRHQHSPSELDPPDPLVDVVHLGLCVCLLLGIGLGDDGLEYRADAEVMRRHGLKEHDLEDVGLIMLSELERIEEVFNCASGDRTGPRGVAKEPVNAR